MGNTEWFQLINAVLGAPGGVVSESLKLRARKASEGEMDMELVPDEGVSRMVAFLASVMAELPANEKPALQRCILMPSARRLVAWPRNATTPECATLFQQVQLACRRLGALSREPSLLPLREWLLMVDEQLNSVNSITDSVRSARAYTRVEACMAAAVLHVMSLRSIAGASLRAA